MGKYSKVILTEYELKKFKEKLAVEITRRVFTTITAYMMEEPEINLDEERIVDMWEAYSRWTEAIDDHTITLNNIVDIIKEKTGLEFPRW